MRRASAISLLAVIGFLLIAPFAFAPTDSNLAACCRRNGVHHCWMEGSTGTSGQAVQSLAEKCPLFPVATTALSAAGAALVNNSRVVLANLAGGFSIWFNAQPLARSCFSRSHQKRGPPSILS